MNLEMDLDRKVCLEKKPALGARGAFEAAITEGLKGNGLDFDCPQALAILGGIYLDQNEFQQAIDAFGRASALKPSSELLSVGLFHALWSSGDKDKAVQEAARFLKSYPEKAEEYPRLIEELYAAYGLEQEGE